MKMDQPTEIGDWKYLADLGSGSFGVVMLWKKKSSEDFIAVKMCKFQKSDSLTMKQRERWCQEVDFLKSIYHPNIVTAKLLDSILESFLEKFNPSELPLLCMEYCKNGNLRKYITNAPVKLCGLCERDLRYILQDISCGLSYLHSKNITHRDIKPENIVLQYCETRKEGNLFKIIDLGYAKELNDSTLSFVGTLYYLAPEIFYSQDYDHRVDYWSLGVMVFEITCGVLPFLPEATPFERYEKIKHKGNDDICIYLSSSGSLTYSSEVKREILISSCFKQNIELWLRSVLQCNPCKRDVGHNLNPLDYLKFILDKKIIEIFYVSNQDFFSYEVYSNTSIGALKNWVARDAKVPVDNLYFIWYNQNNQITNDTDAINFSILNNNGITLYVFNRDALYPENFNCNRKMLCLKELFSVNTKFHIKPLKNFYRQTLYFIYSELRIVKQLKNACLIVHKHLELVFDIIKKKIILATADLQKLLSDMGILIHQKLYLFIQEPLFLRKIHIFVNCLDWHANCLADIATQFNEIFLTTLKTGKASELLEASFSQCDIQRIFDKVNSKGFLTLDKFNYDILFNRMKTVVSDTIKQKYTFNINDQTVTRYLKKNIATIIWAERLQQWIDKLLYNNKTLQFNLIDLKNWRSKKTYAYNKNISECVLKYSLDETKKIIDDNKEVMFKFAAIINNVFT